MFQSITLLKFDTASATADLRASTASSLRAACLRGGWDATVGLPADEAATKSWDLALVVCFRTREQANAFDATALVAASGLTAPTVAVQKSWRFDLTP